MAGEKPITAFVSSTDDACLGPLKTLGLPLAAECHDCIDPDGVHVNSMTWLASTSNLTLGLNNGSTVSFQLLHNLTDHIDVNVTGTSPNDFLKNVAGTWQGVVLADVAESGNWSDIIGAPPIASDLLTTRGDVLIRGVTLSERLAIGGAATYFRSDGTDPSWATIAYADISGTPSLATVATSGLYSDLTSLLISRGDILTRGASADQRLALGTNNQYVKSNGTDALWGTIAGSHVTFSSYLTITSPDIQAAIEELKDEVDILGSYAEDTNTVGNYTIELARIGKMVIGRVKKDNAGDLTVTQSSGNIAALVPSAFRPSAEIPVVMSNGWTPSSSGAGTGQFYTSTTLDTGATNKDDQLHYQLEGSLVIQSNGNSSLVYMKAQVWCHFSYYLD